MKKFLALILMLLLCAGALAEEGSLTFESYAESFEGQMWKQDGAAEIQILEPEEGVTVSACVENGIIVALTVEFPAEGITEAARTAIESLDWLSEDAFEALLAMTDDETAELEGYQVVRIHGQIRDAYSICALENFERMVWQPVHGGSKLHDSSVCSGMDVARMITEEAAEVVGWDDCKRCRSGN